MKLYHLGQDKTRQVLQKTMAARQSCVNDNDNNNDNNNNAVPQQKGKL
jgi:hypothetical protein